LGGQTAGCLNELTSGLTGVIDGRAVTGQGGWVETDHGVVVKTTIRVPKRLWREARIRAFDEGIDAQDLVARALQYYLDEEIEVAGRGQDLSTGK